MECVDTVRTAAPHWQLERFDAVRAQTWTTTINSRQSVWIERFRLLLVGEVRKREEKGSVVLIVSKRLENRSVVYVYVLYPTLL